MSRGRKRKTGAVLGLIGTGVLLLFLWSAGIQFENGFVPAWRIVQEAESLSFFRHTFEKVRAAYTGDADGMIGSGRLLLRSVGIGDGAPASGTVYSADFYPYRTMLSDAGKAAYDQAADNASARNTEPFVLDIPLPEEELAAAMNALSMDHPEFWYLNGDYSYGYYTEGTAVSLQLSCMDADSAEENAFLTAADRILADAAGEEDVFATARIVHDRLLAECVYDTGAIHSQSVWSALVTGHSVCAGYARAFQYLMQRLGIPCWYCEGEAAGGAHAWVILLTDKGCTNIDPSWDDGNRIDYSWFCKPDTVFQKDHCRTGLSQQLPECAAGA